MSDRAKGDARKGRADSTQCVHAGEERHGQRAPLAIDLAQTAVWILPELDTLRRYAQGKDTGYLYTRYANPTTEVAEKKIAALEGGEGCVITASGMAAILVTVLATCRAGDEIISMLDIYGGTLKLFEEVLVRFDVRTRFVPYRDLGRLPRFFSKRTRLLFLETPTNPTLRCVDIARLAALGRKHKACVVVDNTFATPILQKPLELGADVVVHSATKYLGGHSDVTAGAVVGGSAFIREARQRMLQSGASLAPPASYLLTRGLKTLELRVERACENARRIVEFLRRHPRVRRVMYPGLPGHEGHEAARRQMRDFGMMVCFEIKGGGPAAERFINSLKLWYLVPSLGGVESTVSYPILSSHVGMSAQRLERLDVSEATVRLSAGIEEADDLIADLGQALGRA
jgi:cystathionine beta-lyase/cystathionine gamma-synthase